MKKKEVIISLVAIIGMLVIYSIFPTNSTFQNVSVAVGLMVIAPLLYNKFIFQKPIAQMGITKGYWRAGALWSFVSLVFALLIFYIILAYTDFNKYYILQGDITKNFWSFLRYEFFMVLPFILVYELFFRGFSMLFFEKYWGHLMIIVQAAFFILFLFLTESIGWDFLPYIAFSFFSGIIAYKSRSIYYSASAHFLFMVIVDASIIRIMQ